VEDAGLRELAPDFHVAHLDLHRSRRQAVLWIVLRNAEVELGLHAECVLEQVADRVVLGGIRGPLRLVLDVDFPDHHRDVFRSAVAAREGLAGLREASEIECHVSTFPESESFEMSSLLRRCRSWFRRKVGPPPWTQGFVSAHASDNGSEDGRARRKW